MTNLNANPRQARHSEDEDMFLLQLRRLSVGAATTSKPGQVGLKNVDEEAESLVAEIIKRLQNGALTPMMTELLSNYLSALKSEERWKLLGLGNPHRRKAALGKVASCIYGFTEGLRKGMSPEQAEILAYDAYCEAETVEPGMEPRTYVKDLHEPSSDKARVKTKAEETMRNSIRPILVDAGFLPKPPRGRRKKQT